MDIPEIKCQMAIVNPDSVTIPRSLYDELLKARYGIAVIGASETKYGFDSDVLHAVLKTFGIEHKEPSDA